MEFAKKEWLEGLSQFEDDVLHRAILNCREQCEMPPTLPQVIAYCRQFKKQSSFYVADRKHVPAKRDIVLSHLQQCKQFLIN